MPGQYHMSRPCDASIRRSSSLGTGAAGMSSSSSLGTRTDSGSATLHVSDRKPRNRRPPKRRKNMRFAFVSMPLAAPLTRLLLSRLLASSILALARSR